MKLCVLIILLISFDGIRGEEIVVKACKCYMLGTFETSDGKSLCDVSTGKCSCLKNVVGLNCDRCKDGHFGLYSGVGCKSCACNKLGALRQKCDEFSGKCTCKPGYTGHKCEKCHNENPIIDGKCCKCPKVSSLSSTCDSKGRCKCKPHTVGGRCDKCEDNYYYDKKSGCTQCGSCYDLLKNHTKTAVSNLETLSQSLQLENVTTAAGEYKSFEETLAKLKARVDTLKTEEIKSTQSSDIKSLQDFFLKIDGVNEKIAKVREDVRVIGGKYNSTQSILKSGIKQVKNERKQAGKLNDLIKKAEVIITRLESANKNYDGGALKKTLTELKIIEEETIKMFNSSASDISQLNQEVERVKDFTGIIRTVKQEVVQRLSEANNFKSKVLRLSADGVDLERPADDGFVNSVEATVDKFNFSHPDFDLQRLKDKLDKVQSYLEYFEGVKRKDLEIIDEFMQIQTNFNLKELLKRLDEIKESIDDLTNNYNSVNEKFKQDVLPNVDRMKQNFKELDNLNVDESGEFIDLFKKEIKKIELIADKNTRIKESLVTLEKDVWNLQNDSMFDFENNLDAVETLLKDFPLFEGEIKEKISLCEDLIATLNDTLVQEQKAQEHNERAVDEAEAEIKLLEDFYEQLKALFAFKFGLEADIKHIEAVLAGLPEKKNWCNAKETFT